MRVFVVVVGKEQAVQKLSEWAIIQRVENAEHQRWLVKPVKLRMP